MKNKTQTEVIQNETIASLVFAWTGHAEKQDAPELSPLSVIDTKAEAPVLTSDSRLLFLSKALKKSLDYGG